MSHTHYRPRTHWKRLFQMYDAIVLHRARTRRQMDADLLADLAQADADAAQAERDAEHDRILRAEAHLFDFPPAEVHRPFDYVSR